MKLEDLQAELDAMLDARDIPLSWTVGQRDAYEARRRLFTRRISIIRTATRELAEVDPLIVRLTKELSDLDAIRRECGEELIAIPSHSRERATLNRRQGLEISIRAIDARFDLLNECIPTVLPLFEKLKARGYIAPPDSAWNPMRALFGSKPAIERRLFDLQRRRDEAQTRLDAALCDAVTTSARGSSKASQEASPESSVG
jgi:hypothetical protein